MKPVDGTLAVERIITGPYTVECVDGEWGLVLDGRVVMSGADKCDLEYVRDERNREVESTP